jgi:hypothetical protein
MPNTKNIPFFFVLDYLMPLEPYIKPFFGCYGVYVGEKIVFILRDKKSHPEVNGVWIATDHQHHKSLKKEFPPLCSVSVLNDGKGATGWQMLQAEADDFEPLVVKACELILHGDPRIGRIPKPKAKKKKTIPPQKKAPTKPRRKTK